MIGTVVGSYKVIEMIGEGGMGTVYKGVDLMLEREVAIKVLKPELGSQPQVVERFRTEAVTLAKLNHPNIATLFSFFRQGDYLFMVLEYVRGTTLDKIIEGRGSMTCEQAIPLFCQMLEGIDHAHRLGIVHRDIKPANMMLTESGVLKVLDFGIARALGSARLTRAGSLIGTIEYMSPEQVRGLETDARSDIYSLGMVLYELVTGRVPFAGDSEYELMKAQVEQLPPPPREFSPNIPEEVEAAILCATEKDPNNRFQTAGAFSSAIVDCVKSAIATGQLSQIEIQSATARFNMSSAVADLLTPTSSPSSNSYSADAASAAAASVDRNNPGREFAATRIADASYPQPGDNAIKMTRFVPASAALPPLAHKSLSVSSVLSRLNWKYYSAGAVAAVIVLLIAIILPVSLLLRSKAQTSSRMAAPTPEVTEKSGAQVMPVEEPAEPRNRTSTQPTSNDVVPARGAETPAERRATDPTRVRNTGAKRPETTTRKPCSAIDKLERRCS